MVRVQFLAGARDFSLLYHIQITSEAHPASYPIGLGALFVGVKQPGCEAHHLPPSSAKVKDGGAIPPFDIHLHGMVLN
jgi:hypothetical protein